MPELEQRVEKLERQNRKLQFGLVAVVGVLVTAACVGAVVPQEIPDVIEARRFRVVDEKGENRVMLNESGLAYLDENGSVRVEMGAEGISYYDENGENRALMNAEGIFYFDENGDNRVMVNDRGINYYDGNGNRRAAMNLAGIGYSDENGTLRFLASGDAIVHYDENGTRRALMGTFVLPTATTTGAEMPAAAFVILFDAEGNIIWRAPR